MKVRCERKHLSDALTWVTSALPKRPVAPVLAGVKLVAVDDRLTLRAFDYENAHTEAVTADVGDDGTALVNGLLLRDLVGSLDGRTVDLETDDSRLHIRAGRSTYRAGLMPLENYPEFPSVGEAKRGLDAAQLREAVGAVIGSTGSDKEGVQVLTGIRLEADGAHMHVVATNRYRMSTVRLDCAGDDFAATIPGQALEAAVKGLVGGVQVGDAQGRLSLVTRDQVVALAQLDAEYVRWRGLLPDRHTTTTTVAKADLVTSVKRAGRVREPNAAVVFDITADSITLTASGDGNDGREEIDATTDGDPITIRFNPDYVASIVPTIPGDRIRIGMTTPTRPALLLPDVDDPTHRHLLMPIRDTGGN